MKITRKQLERIIERKLKKALKESDFIGAPGEEEYTDSAEPTDLMIELYNMIHSNDKKIQKWAKLTDRNYDTNALEEWLKLKEHMDRFLYMMEVAG